MGIFRSSQAVNHPLQRTDLQLKPFSFKHTGLFPEQAVNWDWFGSKIRQAGRPVKVLNLFAYTGGATLAAAAAGASVTHVDASKGMVTWAERKCCLLRSFRRPDPLAGRRLYEIRGTGNPPGKPLRRNYHGSAFLRPGTQRGKSGKSKILSILLSRNAPGFSRMILSSSWSTPTPQDWPRRPYLHDLHGAETVFRPGRFPGDRSSGKLHRTGSSLRRFRALGKPVRFKKRGSSQVIRTDNLAAAS